MRIWLHLLIGVVTELSAFALGAIGTFFGMLAVFRAVRVDGGVIPFVLGCVAAFASTLLVRWLLRKIPARCPQCGGRAFAHGIKPTRYTCVDCDHEHRTCVWSNW